MCETSYNEMEKIWQGPDHRQYYDRNCSFGRIAFEEMRRKAKNICQISDTEGTTLTFEEVRLQAIRIARRFETLGIQQYDIIGIIGRNTTNLMALVVACFFHGSAYHALSPNFDKHTAHRLFNITKPKIVFCDGQDYELVEHAVKNLTCTIYTLKNHRNEVPTILEFMQPTGDEIEYQPAKLDNGPEQTLAILCSSGTSGHQKAVTIPHCSRILSMLYLLTANDRYLATSTIDWLSAPAFLMSSIVHGITRVITDKPLDPVYLAELVEKYEVTTLFITPLVMASIAKQTSITADKFDSVRHFMYGGYKCNLPVELKMQSLLRNCSIQNSYGLTEFNSALTLNFDFEKKSKSVGKLLSGVKICIVNENGERLSANQVGEIWCRHDEYWGGYYDNDEATCGIYTKDGWFRTGDLGYFDEDNYLFVVERLKDLLRYKSIMYYPSEVEAVIAQMPEVKDVCVFGIEDEVDGERAAAAVVLMEGSNIVAQDVIEYVRRYDEAWFRQLHGGCKIFKELPKTANMKISRRAVKAAYLEGEGEIEQL